jgi:hypothetical protein
MSEDVKMESTGLADLDNILADKDGLTQEPMVIEKKIFDVVLLPLLRNELSITSDESFNHIRNIWINYYKQYSSNRVVMNRKNSTEVELKSMGGNAVFIPMAIKDENDVVIATTPPLIEPVMIVGMNEILEEYSNEMKHNPNVAKAKLINTIRQYTIATNKPWVDFINSYGADGITDIEEEDNDDLIIRS